MKILLVNKFLHPQGGSETYTFKIGEYLETLGHEIEYFGMEHEGRIAGNRINAYTSDMDFHSKGLAKLLYPLKIIYSKEAKKQIIRVLEDFQPDVVHINNFNFQLTPSILYGIKKYEKLHHKEIAIVHTAHDVQLVCPNHLMLTPVKKELCDKCAHGEYYHCVTGKCIHNSLAKSMIGAIEAYLYKIIKAYQYFDVVICPSVFNKEQLNKNNDLSNKTVLLRNFVPMTCHNKQANSSDYVLFFGRYSEEKGIHLLIEACKKLKDIPFVFAGNGPLQDKVDRIDNIINLGFLCGDELSTTIQKARFVVLPSICYENSPFSIMESNLNGTPVIGSDIGGIPELIENGETGLLFQNRSIEDLINKIEILWNDDSLYDKLSENCKKIQYDTINLYCEKLLNIYQFILDRKKDTR